ncbi:MAG: queuine tRNA-ribosyltransferase family protein [Anaerolineae bacterium]|nr:queuine tRNA-ribosyltransferase family protein [Anaerolineae bacterium]
MRTIGSRRIETPNFIASYRIRDYPRAGLRCHPWRMTDTQVLLLNAFDLLANRRTKRFTDEVRQLSGKLHQYVEFDGPIVLDSGAFNFLQHKEISISPLEVLNVGIELGADVSVVLDHPFPPGMALPEIAARWSNTKRNTRMMVNALASLDGSGPEGFQLMPVLHGHDAEALKRALNDVVSILHREPALIGIGSLAPLAQKGSKRTIVDVISTTRRLLPNAHIHCFSMGSALLMLFAFYCGADTVDSQTWIMSAAFKQVQLPGYYLTRLSQSEAEKDANAYQERLQGFARHLLRLVQEEGFAVRDWDKDTPLPVNDMQDALGYLGYLEDRDGINHVHRRACHNLYAFNFEANRVRHEMRAGALEGFIQARMSGSKVYRRVFEYAVAQQGRG